MPGDDVGHAVADPSGILGGSAIHFFADGRFNWMSLLQSGIVVGGPVHRFILTFRPGESPSSFSPLTLPVRSPADPILYLLYRGDQSRRIPRACAARNERSPVLSVFPSVCPEDRSTGRLPYPLLAGPFWISLPLPLALFLSPPSPAILRSLGSLAIRSRHRQPGRSACTRDVLGVYS